jgi:hypothetical protein
LCDTLWTKSDWKSLNKSEGVTIPTEGAFKQFALEPPIAAGAAAKAAPRPSGGLGQLGQQRLFQGVLVGQAHSFSQARPFLLEGRGMLVPPSPFEPTRAIFLSHKALLEESWRRFFVPPGEEILPRTLAVELRQRDEVQPYLASLRNLIEREQIATARRMLNALPLRFLDHPEINRVRRALALPTVRKSQKRDLDRTREYEWIRINQQAYRGQWVALDRDRLLAAADSLRELREQLGTLRPERPPLIHRIQ